LLHFLEGVPDQIYWPEDFVQPVVGTPFPSLNKTITPSPKGVDEANGRITLI
jgi:hypothetical protein